jgi:hypothetical protein
MKREGRKRKENQATRGLWAFVGGRRHNIFLHGAILEPIQEGQGQGGELVIAKEASPKGLGATFFTCW